MQSGHYAIPAYLKEENKEGESNSVFSKAGTSAEVPELVLNDTRTHCWSGEWGEDGGWETQLLPQIAFKLEVCRLPKFWEVDIHHHTMPVSRVCLRNVV